MRRERARPEQEPDTSGTATLSALFPKRGPPCPEPGEHRPHRRSRAEPDPYRGPPQKSPHTSRDARRARALRGRRRTWRGRPRRGRGRTRRRGASTARTGAPQTRPRPRRRDGLARARAGPPWRARGRAAAGRHAAAGSRGGAAAFRPVEGYLGPKSADVGAQAVRPDGVFGPKRAEQQRRHSCRLQRCPMSGEAKWQLSPL